MSRKRTERLLIAGGLITVIAVAGTELYVIRDLLAAFLVFYAFLGALGLVVLVLFFLGDGILRCFELVVAGTASLFLRQHVLSHWPLRHGIGKNQAHQ
jgi:hypothetical protein